MSIHSVLGLILCKYLHATGLQIALLTSLRPVVSFFSFYWSSLINKNSSSLKKNLMAAHALSLIPFLFVPLFPNISYMIFASAMFTLFYRAEAPALMEILRRNLLKEERETAFSRATTAAYVEGIALALFSGFVIERLDSAWVILFPIYATISLFALWFQYRLIVTEMEIPQEERRAFSFIEPLKTSIEILKNRPDFFRFQLGYFFCGGGLMLAQPALPGFLTGCALSFTLLFTSMGAIKQLGMIVATPFWGSSMKKVRYETLSACTFLCVSVFLACIYLFELGMGTLFLAYFIYGIAQAGSHMIWNLSGPYFSREEESSRYTMVNVFMVGLRGCLLPPIGGLITDIFGPMSAIFCGMILCLMGTLSILPIFGPQPEPQLAKK